MRYQRHKRLISADNFVPDIRRKIGWYEVQGNQYTNKFRALEQCRDWEWPTWNFNDLEYGKHNWEDEPAEDLYTLYRDRAIQLRLAYDKLVIFFSGGIDSMAMLHTFIDNNIPVDGIVVVGAFDHHVDGDNRENLEQEGLAIPYLEKLRQHRLITCPVILLDACEYYDFGKDESWVYDNVHTFDAQATTFVHAWKHPALQDILNSGRTAFVRGIDKPRVVLEDDVWYAAFLDIYAFGAAGSGVSGQDWDIVEYFYWTPDMPNIVSKQAHEIIKYLEQNVSAKFAQDLCTKNGPTFDRKIYHQYVDPICYSKYTDQDIGAPPNYLTRGKEDSDAVTCLDKWFYADRDSHKAKFDAWVRGMELINGSISATKLNTIQPGKVAKVLNRFGLDNLIHLEPILSAPVGTWSPFYKIKDAEFNEQ